MSLIRFGLRAFAILLVLCMFGCRSEQAYRDLGEEVRKAAPPDSHRHFAIYMDVRACLSCCESMEAWKELERRLPECGCSFSLWAPLEDSVDAAVAMQMEGLESPVHVLGGDIVDALGWRATPTPIKLLFDSTGLPLRQISAAGGATASEREARELIAEICGASTE